jgi:hypothetical protein
MVPGSRRDAHRPRSRWLRPGLALGIVLIVASGCGPPRPGSDSPDHTPRAMLPPGVSPPAPIVRAQVQSDPGALPVGARAHFPAYDGDPFFVTLPVRAQADVRAQEALQGVIAPILKAIGFQGKADAFAMPPDLGVAQPRADFKRLGRAVADEYARNPKLHRLKTRDMLDVFLGIRPADRGIDRALSTGTGMTFAEYVAGIERLEIEYPFQQVHAGVPIEHSVLVASRWEGQAITSVYGSVLGRYRVENQPRLTASTAIEQGARALGRIRGIQSVPQAPPLDGPYLMLLPYGTDTLGTARLRYAYRMLLRGVFAEQEGEFRVWLDADTGTILKMKSLLAPVLGNGSVYNRDPGVGTTTQAFEVDPASGGQYTLQRSGVSNRLDYRADGYDAADVSIAGSSNGSSPNAANFGQPPLNDADQALCAWGTNKGFQQVNVFATLTRHRDTVLGQGIAMPFPATPWSPKVETATCNAWSGLSFGACKGYTEPTCPKFYSGVPTDQQNLMNFAHDNTMIAHELGHRATKQLTDFRPADWCGKPVCAEPVGWAVLHDLADFWAAHLESTPCIGGWIAKNMKGVDASLNCKLSDEGGSLPRKLEVVTPLNAQDPRDHFPEHRRKFGGGEYSNGQIGGAALWQVREGMRSKDRVSSLPQFGVRFQRALRQTGNFSFEPDSTDLGVYQLLYDLEIKMVDQWAISGSPGAPPGFDHNGPHTMNKVTAGFARAGIFLIPYQCLDGKSRTSDATSCPQGENGGDAVIDIDDNDTTDDLVLNGVTHPEVDFLKLGGPAPTFHVWTGPRYRLAGADGAATYKDPAPCNARFQVDVSTKPDFPQDSTVTSDWQTVATNLSAATAPCYGAWTPGGEDWMTLQSGGAGSSIYYRARTQNAAGGNERLSTLPGNGLRTVPPPYAVITLTGQPDY